MLKRSLIPVVFIALVFSSLSFAQIDKIAIFNELVGWTTVGAAAEATDILLASVTSAADITIYDDAGMGAFAEDNTGDGNFDIIVTFGYWPVSLYTPGNEQADGSLGELFLEGGDVIMNSADYIFYVTEGGGANGDTGLKNMTDSNFDCWTDGAATEPTAEGASYTPSLEAFTTNRGFVIAQIEDDADWELEVAFGSDGATVDPAILRNLTYGGRVAIFFQVSNDALPRGAVVSEMIDNYLAGVTTAVEPADKLAVTWGSIK
jgi:hypothetical protein